MKISHQILRALLDSAEPLSVDELEAATKLKRPQLAGNISPLVERGDIKRLGDNRLAYTYTIDDRQAVENRLAGKSNGATKPPKKKKKARVQKSVAAPRSNGADHTLEYFIGESGGLRIVRADGKGEPALIGREEALRLRDFLNQCTVLLEPDE